MKRMLSHRAASWAVLIMLVLCFLPFTFGTRLIDVRSQDRTPTTRQDIETAQGVTLSSRAGHLEPESSTPPSAQWDMTYGGQYDDFAYSAIQTSDGRFALAGYTYSSGAGLSDFWLVKTDAFGTMVWNKTYGGAMRDEAFSMIQTSDGGYALAGITRSFGAGMGDFWLVKTDGAGTMLWNMTYGGTSTDEARSVVQTSDGGYVLAGYTMSIAIGAPNFWLVKTDASGTMQWNETYGGTTPEYAYSVIQASDGGYLLAGYLDSYSGYDMWLVKTYSNGTMQWNQTFGGQYNDKAFSVIQTSDGGYALAGYTDSLGTGATDFWLVKTDANGVMQWNQSYGEASTDEAYDLVQTNDGGYVLTGWTASYGAGGIDFWLVKTDSSGSAQWNQTYGGTGEDEAFSVVQTTDWGYALAGYTYSYGAGDADFWLVKVEREPGRMFVDPAERTFYLPPTSPPPYPRYNFSIMVENLPQVRVISCSIEWNTTAVNITREWLGIHFDGWTMLAAEWNFEQGYIDLLTAVTQTWPPQALDITFAVEVFKVEVEIRSINAPFNTLVDIYYQEAWADNPDNPLVVLGDCPYDHMLFVEHTRDVAVLDVTTCKDGCKPFPTVSQNYTMHINVTVENQGSLAESFNVTVYANSTLINQTELVLPVATSTVLTIKWNATLAYGNYTISAMADVVENETDTEDNTCIDGTVLVTIPGDVNGDFQVKPKDLNTLLAAYGSRPYNPNCDLAGDDHKIGPQDLNMLLSHYGQHYP